LGPLWIQGFRFMVDAHARTLRPNTQHLLVARLASQRPIIKGPSSRAAVGTHPTTQWASCFYLAFRAPSLRLQLGTFAALVLALAR